MVRTSDVLDLSPN